MKLKHILIVFLTTTVLLSSCDQSDDLTGIFTGKTWKLTNIFLDDGSNPSRRVWDSWSEDVQTQSEELLMTKGNFILKFDGLEVDETITGNYNGRAANANVGGAWNADGKKHTFSTDQQAVTDKNMLGQEFITGLQNATKYAGDYNQLQIFFESGGKRKFMLFRVENE